MIRKILHIIFWGILLGGLAVALAFVDRQHQETICKDFSVVILNQGPDALTDATAMRSAIIAATDTLEGRALSEIKPYEIHRILQNIPFVRRVDIQTTISGKVTAELELRQAIIRIMDPEGRSYYIDDEGWIMPSSRGFPARVPVMNGSVPSNISADNRAIHISTHPEKETMEKIFRLARILHEDEFLSKLISQVWISPKGEMELTPVVGEYAIMFGGFDNMEKKFENLSVYYRKGAAKAGWIDYRSIDLRYENQVICSK